MNRFIRWRYLIAFLAISAGAGIAARWWLHIPFWAGFILVAICLLLNGLVAMLEDRRPKGFNGK